MSDETFKSTRTLYENLKSTDSNVVYKTLVQIKEKYVRYQDKIKLLLKHSVIKIIIEYVDHPKYCGISLSIIADGCLELSFVNEVIKYNGIKSLMGIMKSFVIDDIQSKACRALGNMAKFDVGFKAVLLVNPISVVINFLSGTTDVKCKLVAVRTLMILGTSFETKLTIMEENGINSIAKLLHSSNIKLLTCSTKAFANFTKYCSISLANLLSKLQVFKIFVDLCNHANESVQNNALISLKNLTEVEEIRSCLVKCGAIKLFTEVLSTSKSKEMTQLAALALCKCLDHLHMWKDNGANVNDGLKALISILQKNEHYNIHLQVIASLLPLAYERKISTILLELNILEILIKNLEVCIQKNKCRYCDFKELDPNASEFEELMRKSDEIINLTRLRSLSYSSVSAHSMQDQKMDIKVYDSFAVPNPSLLDFSPLVIHADLETLSDINTVTSDYYSVSSSPDRLSNSSPSLSPDIKFDAGSPTFGPWTSQMSPNDDSSSSISHSSTTSSNYDFAVMTSPFFRPVSPSRHLNTSTSNQIFPTLDIRKNNPTPRLSKDVKYDNFFNSGQWSPTKVSENNSSYSISGLPSTAVSDVYQPSSSKLNDVKEPHQNLMNKCKVSPLSHYMHENIQPAQKKMKTTNVNKDLLKYQPQDQSDFNNLKSYFDYASDGKQLVRQSIDHLIITFLCRLYSFVQKKTNSQMADNFFFSVIIDYLCLLHKPCPQAETLLLGLMKNRYSFEKLIGNGFITELNEKFSVNYSCQSSVIQLYEKIKQVGAQEAESDFGIGTLSHILATSSKEKQFNTICAISKLVTQKSSLHKLLFQAKGLSLLFTFLSDSNIVIQRGALISLCELYQTLTKNEEKRKCCFFDSCKLKFSVRCSYEESLYDVTVKTDNGVKILANREKICENSEYFNCLLNGYFCEREAEQITLSDISEKNMKIIFHFLHGCGESSYCPSLRAFSFPVLLELLQDCDRYLLFKARSFVEDILCHNIFPSTVSKIFKQSKVCNSKALMERSLHYFLKMNVLKKNTLYNTYDELRNLEPDLNVFGELGNLIKNLFDCL